MTGSSHALTLRAKVVALLIATTLLAGWAVAAAGHSSASVGAGTSTSSTIHALGKWPVTRLGKKW